MGDFEATPLLSQGQTPSSSATSVAPIDTRTYARQTSRATVTSTLFFSLSMVNHLIPGRWEEGITMPMSSTEHHHNHHHQQQFPIPRSIKRRIFLFLTEPESSIASAILYIFIIVAIFAMNVVMMMQTMSTWQFTPTNCRTCDGSVTYTLDDDTSILDDITTHACVCPPSPVQWTVKFLDWTIYMFSVEWILRVLTFEPPATTWSGSGGISASTRRSWWVAFCQWLGYLTSTTTVLDALAIFPYYAESLDSNGLMSLRLLRIFRVFQLVRLGQYNESFMSLSTVLLQAVPYLKLLMTVLVFAAAFFGSIIYWLEKGKWQYYEGTKSYQFVRLNQYGQEEISPFSSIPAAFWWFFVTATTVGYGDTYPTSTSGKLISTVAMLMGLLVVAFPVSVFSDLWSKELRKHGTLGALLVHAGDDDDDDDEDELHDIESPGEDEAAKAEDGARIGPAVTHPVKSVAAGLSREAATAAFLEAPSNRSRVIRDEIMDPEVGTHPHHSHHHHHRNDHFFSSNSNRASNHSDINMDIDLDDLLVMRKVDFAEIVVHMHSIQESQRHIRGILRKYRIRTTTTTQSTRSSIGGAGGDNNLNHF